MQVHELQIPFEKHGIPRETEMLAFYPSLTTACNHITTFAPHPRLSASRQPSSWVVVPEGLIDAEEGIEIDMGSAMAAMAAIASSASFSESPDRLRELFLVLFEEVIGLQCQEPVS